MCAHCAVSQNNGEDHPKRIELDIDVLRVKMDAWEALGREILAVAGKSVLDFPKYFYTEAQFRIHNLLAPPITPTDTGDR